MKIVLDTNVLVSGLLTPFGPSGDIVRMLASGKLTLFIDARILSEYRDVLLRPKFQFNPEQVNTLLNFIRHNGLLVSTSPLKNRLPDVDDEPFLEISVAGQADCLCTGNKAHYPVSRRQGITVLSPSEFLVFYRNRTTES
jgi:putative PIN family toxin of toxin-antitoxin system